MGDANIAPTAARVRILRAAGQRCLTGGQHAAARRLAAAGLMTFSPYAITEAGRRWLVDAEKRWAGWDKAVAGGRAGGREAPHAG